MASVVIAALAGFWFYIAVNLPVVPPPLSWIRAGLWKLPRGSKLTSCPWCLGPWVSGTAYVALSASEGTLSVLATPVGVFAAAGLTGLLGSFVAIGENE